MICYIPGYARNKMYMICVIDENNYYMQDSLIAHLCDYVFEFFNFQYNDTL